MQREEDACGCTASLKTNKSIEMKTKIEGETELPARVFCVSVCIFA